MRRFAAVATARFALATLAATGCAHDAPRPAHPAAPRVRVVSAPAIREVSAAKIRVVSALGLEPAAASPPATPWWTTLPAPHRIPRDQPLAAITRAEDLRALVGRRERAPALALALGWATELGATIDPGARENLGELAAWARGAARFDPFAAAVEPGDLLVFDRAESGEPADLVAIVVARDARGVIEMIYASGGVIRRGFVDPRRPSVHREHGGAVVNTYLRTGNRWPPKGTHYLAGELLAGAIRAR